MKRLNAVGLFVVCLMLTACAYQPVAPTSKPYSDQKRLSLAQAHLLLGQSKLAKRQLDLVDIPHQKREYWRLLSLYWLSSGDTSQAINIHRKALLKYPHDDFLLNNLGVLLGQSQRWDQACASFQKASLGGLSSRQSVWINLSRCGIRQDDVKNANHDLNRAKEIADLPVIGLMTELNLVLIQGNLSKARLILNNIQAETKNMRDSAYFDEYNCLSRQVIASETDPTIYSSASSSRCLDRSRY